MKSFFFLFLFLFLVGCAQVCVDKICFDDSCFEVELPRTNQEFMTGLMFREHLPENEGMLFVFQEEAKHSFWMKNTLIPLDIIWMNKDLEVVHIETATPCEEEPCTVYAPTEEALYVLEINAGLAEKNDVFIGSKVSIFFCD